MAQTAILLIGHGTRSEVGTAEFYQLTQRMRERYRGGPVCPCFLELQRPGIEQAVRDLVAAGVRDIIAAPVLLFSAGHAQRDIPETLDRLSAEYPTVVFRQADVLGLHRLILSLSHRRYEEAVFPSGDPDPETTMLVMVGRGSLDDAATADMIRLTDRRFRHTAVAAATTGFVAMSRPSVGDALSEAAAMRHIRTVVVQPHLLFDGELSRRIERMVCAMASRDVTRHWIVTEHLGPTDEVVDALIDRATSTLRSAAVG